MVTEILDEYSNIDTWNFMKQKGLNDAHMDTGQINLTAVGVGGRTYYSVPTPLRNAMEVWGFAAYAWLNCIPALVPASTTQAAIVDGYAALTYTQPQPPATNNTTDAVTAGNLQFRNVLDVSYLNDSVVIAQPATQTAQLSEVSRRFQKFIKFDQPLRLALSQLEIYFNFQTRLNSATLDARVQYDVFYRFVSVTDAEYSALVALSSGQAVLTEVIVA